MDDKDKKNAKLVLLQNLKRSSEKTGLTEEEKQLMGKLLEIERKLDVVENVLLAVSVEKPNTVFSGDIFNTLVGAIAVTAATSTIAEFFGVPKEDVEDLLD